MSELQPGEGLNPEGVASLCSSAASGPRPVGARLEMGGAGQESPANLHVPSHSGAGDLSGFLFQLDEQVATLTRLTSHVRARAGHFTWSLLRRVNSRRR